MMPEPASRLAEKKIATPCINICNMHLAEQICEGCGRTGFEIGNWLSYSDHERRMIIKSLGYRLRKLRGKDIA